MLEVTPLSYPIGESGQLLMLSSDVLRLFSKFQQKRCWMREAGGQLFASFSEKVIEIQVATKPRLVDLRTRFGFQPSRVQDQKDIDFYFGLGLHYVGDWHTHPERIPKKSDLDVKSMRECFRESTHQLNALILVIVGTAEFPEALGVSLHSGTDSLDLSVYPT
jgi:integrative and conjugative element protein (TIGR02256 family)